MDGPIASAVVLPEEPPPPASPDGQPKGHKRRQSSISDESAKRPRLDTEESLKEGREPATQAKPAPPVRRERGRERRLFGAVLGALSQAPSTTAAQKRRSEIEKRQLAQRKLESEESEQRKAGRVARRKVQRWKEQRRFEEQSMRLRHDTLLNTAHFLRTDSTPHLYYKPWDTSAEEDDRIHEQIAEARSTIKREVDEYEARQEEANRGRRASRDADANRDAKASDSGKEQNADGPHQPSVTNGNANGSHNSPKDQDMEDDHTNDPGREAVRHDDTTAGAMDSNVPSHETSVDHPSNDNHDDNGEDVVEEAAEDTVIY
ncbi:hypothetical protein CC86DRAFT_412990 [Ophiobolus disseminans]|uniref:Pinin/SDK/MemA protein domain-containing protein n=1 Tax=Ophiobolus disseminans TaxID=1469910 RepID=A0A6A6ZG95_9PLEO|nr:hypothetical protein CC86DRAFT_412990 [Ophiobolus disseminans]